MAMMASIERSASRAEVTLFVMKILDKLLILLKHRDANKIEELVKGKTEI